MASWTKDTPENDSWTKDTPESDTWPSCPSPSTGDFEMERIEKEVAETLTVTEGRSVAKEVILEAPITEELTAVETRSVDKKLGRDESATLSESWVRVIIATETKAWSETLFPTESRSVSKAVQVGRDESATLSESWTRTITEQPPAAPSNVVATAQSDTQIDLSWTDNATNEDLFRIQRKNVSAGGSYSTIDTVGANVTSYSDGGLQAETTYQYRVRAENTGGNSTYAESNQETTQQGAPSAPSGLTATLQSCPYETDLSWTDNSDNEDDFRIERRSDATGSFGPWGQIGSVGANTTTFTDTDPPGRGDGVDTNVEYRVRACNTSGCSSYSNTDSVVTPGAPAAPTGLSAVWHDDVHGAIQSCHVDLTWTDNATSECNYEVLRNSGVIATLAANKESYEDTSAQEFTSYTYEVRAVNDFGTSGTSSDTVNTGECTTGPE